MPEGSLAITILTIPHMIPGPPDCDAIPDGWSTCEDICDSCFCVHLQNLEVRGRYKGGGKWEMEGKG